MKITLHLSFSSSDLPGLFRALMATGITGGGPPASLFVDSDSRPLELGWLEAWSVRAKSSLRADWESGAWIALFRDRVVQVFVPDYDLDAPHFLEWLERLPFSVGAAAKMHPEWTDGSLGEKYLAPGFGDMHLKLGWGCFFKGDGHKRLCSRRWLDFGPWRNIRGNNDTSLILFHDLYADAAQAIAQARPGHERMGISATGGFIQTDYKFAYDLRGKYDPDNRTVRVVVHGREVSQREMLDACARRLYQSLGPKEPLDNVVYVFVEEAPAAAHLPELWLRELGCHVFRDGVEIDLAADYHPSPVKPDWVQSLKE
jgi:hypothetical protein